MSSTPAAVASHALTIGDVLDDDYGNRLVTAIAFFGMYVLIDREPFKPVEIPSDASRPVVRPIATTRRSELYLQHSGRSLGELPRGRIAHR